MPPCFSSCTVVVCPHCEDPLVIFYCSVWWAVGPPPSRLEVHHIPSRYNFNLFSQAGSRDTILFGIPVPLQSETFSVSLWTRQRGNKVGISFCVCACAHHPYSLSHADRTHSPVTAEKTKCRRATSELGKSQRRSSKSKPELECVCHAARQTSQGRVKGQD